MCSSKYTPIFLLSIAALLLRGVVAGTCPSFPQNGNAALTQGSAASARYHTVMPSADGLYVYVAGKAEVSTSIMRYDAPDLSNGVEIVSGCPSGSSCSGNTQFFGYIASSNNIVHNNPNVEIILYELDGSGNVAATYRDTSVIPSTDMCAELVGHPTNDQFYCSDMSSDNIIRFSYALGSEPSWTVTIEGRYAITNGGPHILFHPSGNAFYQTSSGEVAAFTVDGSGDLSSETTKHPALDPYSSGGISAHGNRVYVWSVENDESHMYSVDSTGLFDGATDSSLATVGPTFGLNEDEGVTFDASTGNIYVVRSDGSMVGPCGSATDGLFYGVVDDATSTLYMLSVTGSTHTGVVSYDLSAHRTPSGGGGDPHFVGLNGVHFLFHGLAGNTYSLVSSANLAVNMQLGGQIGDAEGLYIVEFGLLAGTHRIRIDRQGAVTANGVQVSHAELFYDQTYISCMDDMDGGHVHKSPVSSVAECQKVCSDHGYAFAGLKGGGLQCACFDADVGFHLAPAAWCNVKCAVDGLTCGSLHADGGMSLYEVSSRTDLLKVSVSETPKSHKFRWNGGKEIAQLIRTVRIESGIFNFEAMVEASPTGDHTLNFAFKPVDRFRTQLMDGVLGQTGQDKYYPSIYENVRPAPQVGDNAAADVGGGGVSFNPVAMNETYPLRGKSTEDYKTDGLFRTGFFYNLFV